MSNPTLRQSTKSGTTHTRTSQWQTQESLKQNPVEESAFPCTQEHGSASKTWEQIQQGPLAISSTEANSPGLWRCRSLLSRLGYRCQDHVEHMAFDSCVRIVSLDGIDGRVDHVVYCRYTQYRTFCSLLIFDEVVGNNKIRSDKIPILIDQLSIVDRIDIYHFSKRIRPVVVRASLHQLVKTLPNADPFRPLSMKHWPNQEQRTSPKANACPDNDN